MSCEEISGEERHLGEFDDEFTTRLSPSRSSHTASVPFLKREGKKTSIPEEKRRKKEKKTYSCPPSTVDFIMLVLSRDTDSDEDLEDTTLNRDGGDKTENGVTEIPSLENPEELEETDHSDD